MSQSLVKNYVHIVFSTKHRQPLIYPPYEEELHSYIGKVCKELECQPIKIGGYVDHVHILCMLSKKIALMKLLEEVKSHSSKWMKSKHESLFNFYWQDGYAAFSVSLKELDRVIAYIANQHSHHGRTNYKDEYRQLMMENEMPFDERYAWD